ncbi:hypothetical protein BDB00DRAFT_870850 [Zychaea mexicana]|uniref:uncharacterized protein n=1 Tax=Zychaea mexicana TaxID=64656 RepID=UPI0022FF1784|nr:uncharacterized protein BDB00DRAFT_870850 [Zychaea mexicana]KAI9495135.1 hypothetical protein BDB00DRAFT_870850 [Zychaea mexicana]
MNFRRKATNERASDLQHLVFIVSGRVPVLYQPMTLTKMSSLFALHENPSLPLLKDEQKFEFISDKANEVSVDGEKDVRPIGNKKAKALKRRHAEDDDLESLAGEQVKLARLEVVEEGKILLKMVLREEATGDR